MIWWNYPISNEADLMMSNLDASPVPAVVKQRDQVRLRDPAAPPTRAKPEEVVMNGHDMNVMKLRE